MTYAFVSEREVGPWVNCVPCSVLGAALDAGASAPATLAEAKALRAEAGYPPTGGTAIEKYPPAVKARYGLDLLVLSNITDRELNDALVPGVSAAIEGHLSNFPAGHRLRRYAPKFTGGHAVRVLNTDPGYWWLDPAGPKVGYDGEAVTWGEIATFFDWSAGFLPLKGVDMGFRVTIPSPAQAGSAKIPKGTKAYSLADASVYVVPQDAVRDATTALSEPGSRGILVTLDGEAHFVYLAGGVVFTPHVDAATPLGPGIYKVG